MPSYSEMLRGPVKLWHTSKAGWCTAGPVQPLLPGALSPVHSSFPQPGLSFAPRCDLQVSALKVFLWHAYAKASSPREKQGGFAAIPASLSCHIMCLADSQL